MMSLTMIRLTLGLLVHVILLFTLMSPLVVLETPLAVLMIPLVMSVAWGMAFFPGRN